MSEKLVPGKSGYRPGKCNPPRVRPLALMSAIILFANLFPLGPFAPVAVAGTVTGSGAAGDFLRGDVTGDGVVDGRDALQIMRTVEGYEAATEEIIARGDVYPVPGTGGRLMGDGRLTRDDAQKILRGSVGLVSAGEMSGDFSGSAPLITGLEPASGPVGTVVTIYGANFLEGSSVENVVMFGDLPAPVLSATGTQIVTEAPIGATSGPIQVQTPGGTASSGEDFQITRLLSGQLALGDGLDPQDFTVVNPYGEMQPGAGGGFQLTLPEGAFSLAGAVPNGEGKNAFLAVVPPAAGAGAAAAFRAAAAETVRIDAASTARALLFLHPFFLTENLATARELLLLMDTLPEVETLAQTIARRYPQGAPGLDDPEVEGTWRGAVLALMNSLPPAMVYPLAAEPGGGGTASSGPAVSMLALSAGDPASGAEQPTNALPATKQPGALAVTQASTGPVPVLGRRLFSGQGTGTSEPAVRILGLDRDFLYQGRIEGRRAIAVTPVAGYNPLDWVVVLYRLDPAGFPQGLNTSFLELREQAFPRLPYQVSALVPSKLWTARIDIVYAIADYLLSSGLNTVSPGDKTLPLPDDNEGIYIVRMFSGAVTDPQGFDFNVIQAMPGGESMANHALVVNLGMAAVDYLSLFLPKLDKASQTAIVKGSLKAMQKEMRMSVNWPEMSASARAQALLELMVEFAKGAATALPQYGVSVAQEKLAGASADLLKKSVGILGLLGKISASGRVQERLLALQGLMPNPLGLEIAPGPTPLESALVVVGDPFGPRIVSFSPAAGGAGTEVTITGERFAPAPEQNEVIFDSGTATRRSQWDGKVTGYARAEVLSASPTELKVRAPSVDTGYAAGVQHKLTVATPAGGPAVAAESFNIYRTPLLTGLDPVFGYGPTDNFAGQPFPGTEVGISGRYMNVERSDEGNDEQDADVFAFGETAAEAFSRGYAGVRVRVPAGATGTPVENEDGPSGAAVAVRAIAGDTGIASNPLPFIVVGPPELEEVVPAEVKGGESLVLFGANFSPAPGQTRVRFEFDGQVVCQDPMATAWNMLRVVVPASLPEGVQGVVKVETPAGVSVGRPLTRLAGLAAGGNIQVVTGSAEVVADGVVSLPEAVLMVTGRINPYAPPWDDRDEYVTAHSIEQKKVEDTNGDGQTEVTYSWETGEPIVEAGEGHSGEEFRYFYLVRHYHEDHGGAVTEPILQSKESLDKTDDQVEEGDKVFGTVGADTADTIFVNSSWRGQPVTLEASDPLILDTGYDTIEASGSSAIRAEIQLGSNGNVIKFPTVSNPGGPGIVITGNGNRIQQVSAKNNAGPGMLIDGGDANTIYGYSMDNSGPGVEITGGARGNSIGGNIVRNQTGVFIHGTGTAGNTINAGIGYWSPGVEAGNYGNGVTIAGGASLNEINTAPGDIYARFSVESSGLDGVLVTGPGTKGNIVGGQVNNNTGNGVHITGGASNNSIRGTISRSGRNGILVEGASPDNQIGAQVITSQEAGIKVVGEEAAQPLGTLIKNATAGGKIGLWISGVRRPGQAADDSAATVRVENSSGYGSNSAESVGILLDNGAQRVSLKGVISRNAPVGLLVTGADTAWNEVQALLGTTSDLQGREKGAWIAAGAHDNTIAGARVYYLPEDNGGPEPTGLAGILVDGGAHHNRLRDLVVENNADTGEGDGIVIDGAGDNILVESVAIRNHRGSGIVIRGSAAGNTVHGVSSTNNGRNGILLQGPDVAGAGITGVDLAGNGAYGLVVDGAINTLLDSPMAGSTPNSITGNALAGVRVTGGADSTGIFHSAITGNARDAGLQNIGILIDGAARNVWVGAPGDGGGNVIGDNGLDGVYVADQDTRNVSLENNLIGLTAEGRALPNGRHGVVVDGAGEVRLGSDRPGGGNFISGNLGAGVYAAGEGTGVSIQKNFIGLDLDGFGYVPNGVGLWLTGGLRQAGLIGNDIGGNGAEGVRIDGGANHNLLENNHIAANGGDGVVVRGAGATANELRGNSITANAGRGIVLLDGGNNNLPAPVIDEFSISGKRVQGYVPAGVPAGGTVDVHADAGDEGEVYVGSAQLAGNRFYLRGDIPPGMKLHALVTDPAGNTSPFSPDPLEEGAMIRDSGFAFTSTRDGNREIYFLAPGAVIPARLTGAAAADQSPRLSPDRRRVLFASDRAGNSDVWMMAGDGSGPGQVTEDPAADYDPAWSPDGRQVAFVSERDGNPELYVSEAGVLGPRGEISYDDGTAESKWTYASPDWAVGVHFTSMPGTLSQLKFYISDYPQEFRWVVYNWAGDRPGGEILAEGNTTPAATGWHTVETGDIPVPADYVVAVHFPGSGGPWLGLDSSAPAERCWSYYSPTWSPYTTRNFMFRAVATPFAPLRLTENDAGDRHPAWSPDGTRIAFTSERADNSAIWVMDAGGANLRRLTDGASPDYSPAWSPDGGRIAFVSERDGNPEIYLMASDGSGVTRLTSHPGLDIDPAFTREGRILFSSDREAGLEIYSMDQDGAGVTRLTFSLGANTQPHAGTFGTAVSAGADGFTGASLRAAAVDGGEGSRVVVESKTGRPGATVSVNVDLQGARDLGHLAFELGYDRNYLTLLSLEPGEFSTGGLVAINPENLPSATGQIRFNWVKAAGFSGDSRIITLSFAVAPDAPGGDVDLSLSGLAATLSAAGAAMAEAPAIGQDGAIMIVPASSADVDGNGVVDLSDLAMVAGAYGAMSGSELWNEYLDLTPDDVIDLYDLVLVARRLQPR